MRRTRFGQCQALSCAGVTGSVGVLRHARITQMAGLIESSMLGSHRYRFIWQVQEATTVTAPAMVMTRVMRKAALKLRCRMPAAVHNAEPQGRAVFKKYTVHMDGNVVCQ